MKTTTGTTKKNKADNRESNEVQIPSEPLGEVVSLADYKATRKLTDSVKAVFKDSLDNDAVMKRYNINQPTLEERQERIKQSIQRINGLLKELNNQ